MEDDALERIAAAVLDELVEARAKAEAARAEVEALRAKIAEMERQEPVGWLFDGDFYEVRQMSLYKDNEPLQGQTALYALPGAPEQEPTRDWWDCLIADISAIDCMYRGSPTYAHDAYWMRDHVVWMLKKRRDALPAHRHKEKRMTDIVERLNDSLSAGYSELRKEAAEEILRLRAKVEEAEKQEPVEWQSRTRPVWNNGMWTQWSKCSEGYAKDIMKAPLFDDWMYEARPLYALPGAKGEVK